MTKALKKAIATRSRLENRYYKGKSVESKLAYKKTKKIFPVVYTKRKERYIISSLILIISLTIVSSGRL